MEIANPFLEEVLIGLRAKNKYLPSKYFYDEKGDSLFQEIMNLDEYYLSNKEIEIFSKCKRAILDKIGLEKPFRVIELGAGDGIKTKILLKYFQEKNIDFSYCPIDISKNALQLLSNNMKDEIPNLKIEPYIGDYFNAISQIGSADVKNIIFFLGSNIGNFSKEEAKDFLSGIQKFLNPCDLLFLGVDLKKEPAIILNAYNDKKQITKQFNFNFLCRINQELNGNFKQEKFIHYPIYEPRSGECRSYIISKEDQSIRIGNEEIFLDAWESILMEVPTKYNISELEFLASSSGFNPMASYFDDRQWYANVLWEVV